MAGWVHGIDGGDAYSEVVIQPAGADRIQHKHLAGVKYEDLSLKFGTGMSRGFYDWIKATLARGYPRKNGAIVVADFNFKETARLTFGNGLITEIEFPALDAGSKDAAAMTIDITPANTRWTQGSGGAVPATNLSKAIQSKWLPANFRLQIAGLNTTKVNKIDALTFKLPTVSEPARAEERMPAKQAGVLQIPNLVVTLAATTAAEFYKWFDDFVIRGNGQTKTGTLEYLTPNLQGVLFTLSAVLAGLVALAGLLLPGERAAAVAAPAAGTAAGTAD